MTWDPAFGTVAQWLTAVPVVTLAVAWWRRDVQLRGLSNTDRADIRDHYAQELKDLRDDIKDREQGFRDLERHFREMLAISDQRHQECEDARQEMRRKLEGLERQFAASSVDRVLLLEKECTTIANAPEAVKAAGRLKNIIEGK